MSMFDRSYCSTPCTQRYCERNLKYHKPATRIYTTSLLDADNPDPAHKTCKNIYPTPPEKLKEELKELRIENNNMKAKLENYIPRRRVRRVYNELRAVLEKDLADENKQYIDTLRAFVTKLDKEGDQVAGQEIKTAIQHLLSMRGVN